MFVESSSMRPRFTPRFTVERLELAGRESDAYEGGGEKKLKYPLGCPLPPLPLPLPLPTLLPFELTL